jgi:branched-chain amino acid aminotransferase
MGADGPTGPSMRCPACGFENASGIKFCGECGAPLNARSFDARVKSLNYLKNVLAKIDANRAGAEEAILLNAEGFVGECTADILFVVKHGTLLTPSPQDGALEGITRGALLELAGEARIPAREKRLTRYDVYTADECFLSGTGAEVDGRRIGAVTPGPVTKRLLDAFHALVRKEGDPIW